MRGGRLGMLGLVVALLLSIMPVAGAQVADDSGESVELQAFTDTADSVFRNAIDQLAARGITPGCNPPANTLFCPDDPVTRGQMAIFIVRGFDLGPATADYFDDDAGKVYEDAANRLAEAGLTQGCGPRRYCGDNDISRGEMAAFLTRTLRLPAASRDFFVDDNSSIFENGINRVAQAGITLGCNPPANTNFCPTSNVTRGQMAAFIIRALTGGVTPPPGGPLPLSIGGTLPKAVVEVPYSAQLPISGGVPPYTVTKLSGPIWANVSATGRVTGTPLSGNIGSSHLQVRVKDSKGTQATAAIVLTVINQCQGVTAVPLLQCQALAALYNSTNGNGWTARGGWFVDPNPCNWAGLACAGANISLIRLKGNNLNGTLPAALANLTGLQNVDLSENPGLSGAIPSGLFGITTLRTVILAHNALSGPIPEFTVPLPLLTRLSLDSNNLGESIPTSMNGTNLPAIVELALDENELTGDIPNPSFFTMSTLTSLRLDENQLEGQANGFEGTVNFPHLTRLELGNNAVRPPADQRGRARHPDRSHRARPVGQRVHGPGPQRVEQPARPNPAPVGEQPARGADSGRVQRLLLPQHGGHPGASNPERANRVSHRDGRRADVRQQPGSVSGMTAADLEAATRTQGPGRGRVLPCC